MALNTFSAGVNTSFSSELNTNFAHSITSGTSTPVSFTPTDATTTVFIVAKVRWEKSAVGAYALTATLASDLDGTLDTCIVEDYAINTGVDVKHEMVMMFTGSLSAGTHSLSVVVTGTSGGTTSNIKINVLEFL